ncbi:secondary thiamine-phosphate synthase enzyme YjbQ [Desulfonatronum thioautotrophicum]|uniref:secondary thiamine-phosphate synthase enzyme YjbQ n=1 Tax=Desulfonatronum thioautotrophicum TaxID=617001 RepID=UPI0005EBC565|nr:secondary thiamine-phosphate synthase enzyme YjbQ [Desulfonatronum thioautotrophicum]
MQELTIQTPQRETMVDITAQVQDIVRNQGFQDGMLVLFCPHTTAGLTINENADPTVVRDIVTTLRRLIPHQGDFHHTEGNSDAHIKASMMGSDLRILVEEGRLLLGIWQGIFFTEFDGPRSRKIWLKWFPTAVST